MLMFAKIGSVDLVEGFGSAMRFDANVKNHHHLHCVSCGKIFDFNSDQYNNLGIPDEIQKQFRVLSSRVVLQGVCEECSNMGKMSP
jgi:Fur family peroxide stress response transcriptional regulator